MGRMRHRKGETPSTYDVTVRFELRCERELSDDTIQEMAVRLHQALEEGTPEWVLGTSVVAQSQPAVIEVGLDIVAASSAELHTRLGELFRVVEGTYEIPVEVGDTHFERADDRELAIA